MAEIRELLAAERPPLTGVWERGLPHVLFQHSREWKEGGKEFEGFWDWSWSSGLSRKGGISELRSHGSDSIAEGRVLDDKIVHRFTVLVVKCYKLYVARFHDEKVQVAAVFVHSFVGLIDKALLSVRVV